MTLADLAPGLPHASLGPAPTPVGRIDLEVPGVEVWCTDDSAFGDGAGVLRLNTHGPRR